MRVALFLAPSMVWLAFAAAAETVATLTAHNGSLPPPYHRNLTVALDADLTLTLTACRGYGTEDCATLTGRATPEALAAVLAAAREAGLAERPLAEEPVPPVGGGAVLGTVVLDGQSHRIPAFVLPEDEGRKAAVVAAIRAAVPADLAAKADGALAE